MANPITAPHKKTMKAGKVTARFLVQAELLYLAALHLRSITRPDEEFDIILLRFESEYAHLGEVGKESDTSFLLHTLTRSAGG